MEELIDRYKQKLKIAQSMLKEFTEAQDKEAEIRTRAEINCYRFFIGELELEKDEQKQSFTECVDNNLDGFFEGEGTSFQKEFYPTEERSQLIKNGISLNDIILCSN